MPSPSGWRARLPVGEYAGEGRDGGKERKSKSRFRAFLRAFDPRPLNFGPHLLLFTTSDGEYVTRAFCMLNQEWLSASGLKTKDTERNDKGKEKLNDKGAFVGSLDPSHAPLARYSHAAHLTQPRACPTTQ